MSNFFSECFDPAKVAAIQKLVANAAQELQRLGGPKTNLSMVECMSPAEVAESAPRGYGHGVYDKARDQVRINPAMTPEDIYLNFIHEQLHKLFPELHHAGIRTLTALVDCHVRNPDTPTCEILKQLEERGRE